MSQGYEACGLMQGARDYIRGHIADLEALPPPDERWQARDVPERTGRRLQRLCALGAVERVARDETGRNVYATDERAWALIEDYAASERPLLCDHGGLRNLGDGLYTCGHDACDHRYTRDTVELLLLDRTLDEDRSRAERS